MSLLLRACASLTPTPRALSTMNTVTALSHLRESACTRGTQPPSSDYQRKNNIQRKSFPLIPQQHERLLASSLSEAVHLHQQLTMLFCADYINPLVGYTPPTLSPSRPLPPHTYNARPRHAVYTRSPHRALLIPAAGGGGTCPRKPHESLSTNIALGLIKLGRKGSFLLSFLPWSAQTSGAHTLGQWKALV